MTMLDEDRIRSILQHDLAVAKDVRTEVVMKDTHTICNDRRRAVRWVQIARVVIEELHTLRERGQN